MTAIANQWTGNAVADGTALTSGNVNTAGNGSTVTRSASGTPTFEFAGDGFRAIATTSTDIARLDATFTAAAGVRTQMKVTINQTPSATLEFLHVRTGSATLSTVNYNTGRTLQFTSSGTANTSSLTPATALGDVLLIDQVVALHSSPTTSNGRVFYRVRNLTNLTWNTTGVFFYDSLYTLNVGVATMSVARFGKISSGTIASTGALFEVPGWEGITVSTSDVSSAAAQAYFADAPTTIVQLTTPVVTLASYVNPTTTGGTNGTATISWPAVANAAHYRVEIAPGLSATSGFTTLSSTATSPYTATGLNGGDYTLAVTALA